MQSMRGIPTPSVVPTSSVPSAPVEHAWYAPTQGTLWALVLAAVSLFVSVSVWWRQRRVDISADITLRMTEKQSVGRYEVELRNTGARDAKNVDVSFNGTQGVLLHPFVTTRSPLPIDSVVHRDGSIRFNVEGDENELQAMRVFVSWDDGRRGRQHREQQLGLVGG